MVLIYQNCEINKLLQFGFIKIFICCNLWFNKFTPRLRTTVLDYQRLNWPNEPRPHLSRLRLSPCLRSSAPVCFLLHVFEKRRDKFILVNDDVLLLTNYGYGAILAGQLLFCRQSFSQSSQTVTDEFFWVAC